MDLAPSLRLLMLASAIALLPLGWVWLRQRQADGRSRLLALSTLY